MVRPREVDITQGLSQTNKKPGFHFVIFRDGPQAPQRMPGMLPVCRMRLPGTQTVGTVRKPLCGGCYSSLGITS